MDRKKLPTSKSSTFSTYDYLGGVSDDEDDGLATNAKRRPKTSDAPAANTAPSMATTTATTSIYLDKGMFLGNVLKLPQKGGSSANDALPEINPLKAIFSNSDNRNSNSNSNSSNMGSSSGYGQSSTKTTKVKLASKPSKEAWPEEKTDSIPHLDKDKRGGTSKSKSSKISTQVLIELNNLHDKLNREHADLKTEQNLSRMKFMQSADDIIHKLPLKYLMSKPELRHFALERVSKPIIRLAMFKAKGLKRQAFTKFQLHENSPINQAYNERQVGFMVLAKRLIWLLKRALSIKFMHWAMVYSSRFAAVQAAAPRLAAITIQTWFRHIRIVSRDPWRKLAHAIQTCIHRRKAVQYTIKFEQTRRQTVAKIKRGISQRRRVHFAARMIQRVFRWVLLYTKMRYRLTRQRAARKIQGFVRMFKYRKEEELLLIKLAIRMGGYSRVKRRLERCPKQYQFGYLGGINACVSMLQKAWFTSKGSYAMFIKLAARKAKALHDKLLNDSATMIQNNYRGHLWWQLVKAAVQNNRARRISFSFRHYQYRISTYPYRNGNRRSLESAGRLPPGKPHNSKRPHRQAKTIQKFARWFIFKINLTARFKLRRYMLVFTRAKKQLSAIYIQRAYRAHALREKIKKEELRKFLAAQRGNTKKVYETVVKIQRSWRKMLPWFKRSEEETFEGSGVWAPPVVDIRKWEMMFIRHVYLLIQRQYRDYRRPLSKGVEKLQILIRRYLNKRRVIRHRRRVKMANRIWNSVKRFLLRQAIWDRVCATRIRKRKMAVYIKRQVRWMLWWRMMKVRFAIRRARMAEVRLRTYAANKIQALVHRKYIEYFSAVRLAGRRQLVKRLKREEEERIWKMRDNATRVIVKFMRLFPVWNRNMKFVKIWRRYYIVKRFVKFCKMIFKWAKFRKASAIKEKAREKSRVHDLQSKAAGVIGFYYRRKKEGHALLMRFTLRKQMLDVYKKLDKDKKDAEELQRIAEEDKLRTDENLAATIAASWKQGSDPNGRNYYYNFVTGESQWNPPENWNMKAMDVWIRQIDDKGNVYYYNQILGESQWLPPCVSCGEESTKWCQDCSTAYCDKDYDKNHGDDADDSMQNHLWSAVEYAKDKLGPGEIYCMECKKRKAARTCTTCWDHYCDECFKRVHHVGTLRTHKTLPYKKAKAGWSAVKGKSQGELDYYVNGMTGEITYDKPEELMTFQEKLYYDQFLNHKKAAEDHVKKIDELQLELEATIYERDSILYEAINGSGNIAGILKKRKKKGGTGDDDVTAAQTSTQVIEDATKNQKEGGGMFEFLSPAKILYRTGLLKPTPRARGKAKSDYIKSLLDEDDPADKKK